jgi:hypothetical protein
LFKSVLSHSGFPDSLRAVFDVLVVVLSFKMWSGTWRKWSSKRLLSSVIVFSLNKLSSTLFVRIRNRILRCRVRGTHGGEYKDGSFLGCSAVIRAVSARRPDDGGSNYLWNVCKFVPVYTVLQPRRQPYSNITLLYFYFRVVWTLSARALTVWNVIFQPSTMPGFQTRGCLIRTGEWRIFRTYSCGFCFKFFQQFRSTDVFMIQTRFSSGLALVNCQQVSKLKCVLEHVISELKCTFLLSSYW